MKQYDPASADHQRRWLKPDWQRWMRHDAHLFAPPGANTPKTFAVRLVERMRAKETAANEAEQKVWSDNIARLRWMIADLRIDLAFRRLRLKYDANQPRVPKGDPKGGQWTKDGSGDAGKVSPGPHDEVSSARQRPRFSGPKGHHYVPHAVHKNLPLSPEARKVFQQETTGPLRAQRHGWSQEHDQYNQAVGRALERYVKSRGISYEQMTADQAREFVGMVKRSTEPQIRDLNLKILRRELIHILRTRGRRNE